MLVNNAIKHSQLYPLDSFYLRLPISLSVSVCIHVYGSPPVSTSFFMFFLFESL